MNVKSLYVSLFILINVCFSSYAQNAEGFQFTTIKEIPITSIKNQASSGTCWSFSGLGFIEAELLRKGKGEYDLSEMFVVHKNYTDKAVKYVRLHGEGNFGGGGSFADVLDCIKDYGIVPDDVLPGLNYGEASHKHGELDNFLRAYIEAVVKNPNKKLSPAWFRGYLGIVNAYLGECPETFTYKGKEYSPKSFAQSLDLNMDDYVSITSFTHHPFYTEFPVEVPDNWRWANSYNLPLNEMMQVIDNAIDNGYTIAWASDVSEKGFNRKGIAVIPDAESKEGPGSDQAHWLGLSQKERNNLVDSLKSPVPEKKITQELRQEGFNNYETGDDHGMVIYGTAKDQYGNKYYLVKNSWGTGGENKGIWHASVPFVAYKTISFVVHKDAVPKDLKKKLNIK